jgi:hypothetical protein
VLKNSQVGQNKLRFLGINERLKARKEESPTIEKGSETGVFMGDVRQWN